MGVHMGVVDLDFVFANCSNEPIILNGIDVSSVKEKERLNAMIYTRYEGDTLDMLPSCDCGSIKGEYNVGVRCSTCGTEVHAVTERPLESTLWIAAPEGVRALINPHVWAVMSNRMQVPGGNLLEWLCSPDVKLKAEMPRVCQKLLAAGHQRGLNYFIDHFDAIIDDVFRFGGVKGSSARERQDLRDFITENRAVLFPKHLPIPSKLGFITESTPTGTYADTNMTLAINAIRSITSISSGLTEATQRVRENRALTAIMLLAEYYVKFYSDSLSSKEGWYRKHVFGSRLHFSFRAVISSLSDNHRYDEVHLPWSMSVLTFKAHLTNKLMRKHGFTPNECVEHLYKHTHQYCPILDACFQELINESPYGGIPIILQRNPTLVRLSAQALRVTRIKTDPSINTISMSVLALKGPNADFDGDALNGMIILDHDMYCRMQRFAPHLGVLDLDRPRSISKNIVIPPPVLSTISNWMYKGN